MANATTPLLSMSDCIPFLGYLIAFAYAGNTVIVFEGHLTGGTTTRYVRS